MFSESGDKTGSNVYGFDVVGDNRLFGKRANSGIRSQASETIELKLAHFWPATHPVELNWFSPGQRKLKGPPKGGLRLPAIRAKRC